MANVEVCVIGRLGCDRRARRGASKEEGVQGGGCAVKFSGLGRRVRRGTPPGALEGRGAWTDGDGRTGGRVDGTPCLVFHRGWAARRDLCSRRVRRVRRERPSQRVRQASLILTGGRHLSYRPALVFPHPVGAAPPPKIWHPAILWCVPPSFGGERAGMGGDAMPPLAGALAGLGFRPGALGPCRRSVAPRCRNRAEWPWADHPVPHLERTTTGDSDGL
jgi:hypothetical protein